MPTADLEEYIETVRSLLHVSGAGLIVSWWPIQTRGDQLLAAVFHLVRTGGLIRTYRAAPRICRVRGRR